MKENEGILRLNRKLSKRLSKKIKAENTQCYKNSVKALLEIRSAIYVEGFAIDDGEIVCHGWLELGNEIIDVTPIWIEKTGTRYFAGIRYPFSGVAYFMSIKDGFFPFAAQDGRNGQTHFSYMQALRDAFSCFGANLDNFDLNELTEKLHQGYGCDLVTETKNVSQVVTAREVVIG